MAGGAKSEGASTPEIVKWLGDNIQDFHQEVAEETVIEEAAAGRFTETPLVVTDGMPGKDYHAVKPFGRIEFIDKPEIGDAVRWAIEMLRRLSPRGPTGRYIESHFVLLNGQGVTDPSYKILDTAKPGDRVQIVNIQPYARKIEGARANRRKQWKGRRGLSRQAPGGVYRKVLTMLQQRYGRSLFVDYRLEKLEVDGLRATSSSKALRSKGGFYTYPVIQFYLKPPV